MIFSDFCLSCECKHASPSVHSGLAWMWSMIPWTHLTFGFTVSPFHFPASCQMVLSEVPGFSQEMAMNFHCCLAVSILWMWCRCTGCIWIFFLPFFFNVSLCCLDTCQVCQTKKNEAWWYSKMRTSKACLKGIAARWIKVLCILQCTASAALLHKWV